MKKQVEYVTAYKGQLTQRFTRKSWEVMGTDKCGWALVPEVPKEVKSLVDEVVEPLELPKDVDASAGIRDSDGGTLTNGLTGTARFANEPSVVGQMAAMYAENISKPTKRRKKK